MQVIIKAFAVFWLSLFMMPDHAPTENPCNIMFPRTGTEDWGSGLYLLPNKAQINIYSGTNGELFGKLAKVNNYLKFWDENGRRRSLKKGDIEYIGHYSMSFLKVSGNVQNGYIKVFWNSFDEGLYVKKSELERQKAKFYSYKELLYNKNIPIEIEEFRNWASIGVNLSNSCLNLRKGPSTSDGVIRCISSNKSSTKQFSHFSLLETKGAWAKVEVSTYIMTDEAQSECDYNESSREVGWIKALDDNGFPNIWYSVMNY